MSEGIFFKSPEHKQRLLEVMKRLGKVYGGKLDPEYGVECCALTANLSTWEKAQGYVKRHGMDIEKMLKEADWSGGYRVLVQWAGNLFNNEQHIDPVELMRLDESNFRVAVNALKVRRYGLSLADIAERVEEA